LACNIKYRAYEIFPIIVFRFLAMWKIRNVSIVVFLLGINSCGRKQIPENKLLSGRLTGVWDNLSLKIKMNSFNNTDSTRVFEVDEKDWEQKMRIRPIRTIYRKDGSYNSEHRNLNDSIIYNPAGKWYILGDTIFMTDTFPERGLTYKYHVRIKGNIVEFTGVEDCDRDGKKDDEYFGIQCKE
jgi:hypothetical protein